MYAVEFQASIKDGMIEIPKEYQNLANNRRVKFIMMYDEGDDLELKENRATIAQQVENYYNGSATLLNKDESSEIMRLFMDGLKSKYADS